MAHHHQPPVTPLDGHLQSPPMTPSPEAHSHFAPPPHQPSSGYKRMDNCVQTPPLEYIEPTGLNYQFSFTRPQSCEPSSRPSSDSERAFAATTCEESDSGSESDDEHETDEESDQEEQAPLRRVDKAQFILEELDSDPGYDCDVEVVQPDHCEDAKSERSGVKAEIFARMNELQLEDEEDSSEDEERVRKWQHKKKRWSAGISKRSYSQSVEGDSSYSDNDPLDDIDPNARRLRRRVRGPRRESMLIFEDRGVSNINNILEVEEPEEGTVLHSQGPPSIPSDDGFTLDELPFWRGHEHIDVEYEYE